MGLPFDVFWIGDSWTAFNYAPGQICSPVKITFSSGNFNIPLLNLVRVPRGAPNSFDSGGGYWVMTDPGTSGSYPDGKRGWTTRGLGCEEFNQITGMDLADANHHFYGQANATLQDASGTGLWSDFNDVRTWKQIDPSNGKTAFENVRHPPTGRGMVIMHVTGNDWLTTYHGGGANPNTLYGGSTGNPGLITTCDPFARSMLNTIYTANPLIDIHLISYCNMSGAESDGTGTYQQYNGDRVNVLIPDPGHFGLTSVAGYPNPPGTRYCPQLTTPTHLTPATITSIPFFSTTGIDSPLWSRIIWASSQMISDYVFWTNQFNNWYCHWYADTNYNPPFGSWSAVYNINNGSSLTTQVNTSRVGFATQTIANSLLNAAFQQFWRGLWQPIETDFQNAGFNFHIHDMWESMNDVDFTNSTGRHVFQVGTNNPATQSMNKYGFMDGNIHLDYETARIFTQKLLVEVREASSLIDNLHGMKLTASTIGTSSAKIYAGVPGNIGQDRVYVKVTNTGSNPVCIGDPDVTYTGGALPGIPIAVGATADFTVYGLDDMWAISTGAGTTVSVLRTGTK